MRMRWLVSISLAVVSGAWPTVLPAHAAPPFAHPAFQQAWRQGEAIAANFWGPLETAENGQREPYNAQGTRLVQYFDKGRMELNALTNTVTSGLRATDLVQGQIQTGDATFQAKPSPAIPIVGDPDNSGPTYAQLATTAKTLFDPTARQTGASPQATVSSSGTLSAGGVVASGPSTFALFDDLTRHNVPKAFAEYRERAGMLTIGLAIAEPFSATVMVAGQQKRVLVQVFERRVLTYTDSNPVAFRVEMGNIGQHYFRWRYGAVSPSPPPAAASTPAPQSSAPRVPLDAQIAPSAAAADVRTFSGTGTQVTQSFPLKAGLVVFRAMSRGGSGAFVAELRDNQGNFIDLVANEVGPSTTSRLAGIQSDGMYQITVQYDGAWSIEVGNPGSALANPIGTPTTLTGAGTTITPALTLSRGLLLVNYRSKGSADFVVELYRADGAFVDLGADDLANRSDTRAIPIQSAGTYIFGVVFDGEWTLTLSP